MDREKVINDLQDAVNDDWIWRHADYYALTMERAIALLEEQKAVAPTWQQGKAYCGSCGKRIPLKIGARYCHKCGKPILWEGR